MCKNKRSRQKENSMPRVTVLAPPITGTTKKHKEEKQILTNEQLCSGGGPGSGTPVGCIRACDLEGG